MAGEVDLGWLCGVVARHAPTLHLHPRDAFMPCTAEFFLQHSELWLENGGRRARLLRRGGVAGPLLLEAQAAAPPAARLWLQLDPAARPGTPVELLDDVPLYAHPKLVLGRDGRPEAVEVTYITLYAHNGPYRVGGLGLLTTGAHDGDWEHLTARLHPTTGELLAVWYNAHRCRDGCWVAASQVPRDPQTGRLVAYVALHGHGTYPAPGRVLRHLCLGNDLCSGDGPVWRPRRVVLLPPTHEGAPAGRAPPAIGAGGCHASVQLDDAPGEGEGGGADGAQVALGSLSLDEAAASDEPAATAAAHRRSRSLPGLPSRGSPLPAARGGAPVAGGGSNGAGNGAGGLPQVVTDDPCEWVFFRGDWGSIEAPIEQAWFNRAEPPVSRTKLLRIFGHFVAEPA